MGKCIVFRNAEGNVSVITPSPEWLNQYGINEIARKDVPASTPYKIVDSADVPEDRESRNELFGDFSLPDGYGVGAEAWFKERGML